MAYISQEGFYPPPKEHVNQDRCGVWTAMGGQEDSLLMGVFDGHGTHGHHVSEKARNLIEPVMAHLARDKDNKAYGDASASIPKPAETAYFKAFDHIHKRTMRDLTTKCNFSGTTAITALVCKDMLHVANVGDSRAIMGKQSMNEEKTDWDVVELSHDQTCFRDDERERVRKDARVGVEFLTVGMKSGETPVTEDFGEESIEAAADPPRVYMKDQNIAGTAFTRSLGDAVAKETGVIADPEIYSFQLDKMCKCIMICSDGVSEFLTNEHIMAVCKHFDATKDPHGACAELVDQAFECWLQYDEKSDDITAIVAYLECPYEHKNLAKSKWKKVQKNFTNCKTFSKAKQFRELVLEKLKEMKKYDKDLAVKDLYPEHDWADQSKLTQVLGQAIDYGAEGGEGDGAAGGDAAEGGA